MTARIWDANTAAELRKLDGHKGAVFGVAVMRNGTRIVTASADRTARVWDAATGTEVLQLVGHEGPVYGVAVAANETRIITVAAGADRKRGTSAEGEGTVRVWDAETGVELLQFKGHKGVVHGVAVLPDGTRFVTGSADQTARVWALTGLRERKRDDKRLLVDAQDSVRRCLSIAERKSLVLRPAPPKWCIDKHKYPYDTDAWKDGIASQYGDFADAALRNGDFPNALKAADLGIEHDSTVTWIKINRAHALMFMGKEEEALVEYGKGRGTTLPGHGPWEKVIVNDLAVLEEAGLPKDRIDEIVAKVKSGFAKSSPPAQ
jgi:WD40 repeat protein